MSRPTTLVKLLLLGDSGVGKTSMLFRFSDNAFNNSFISTIGIDFKVKTVEVRGRKVKLQIWDTAGSERFHTLAHNYYRNAMGIVLVYDVTNSLSFQHIGKWLKDIEDHAKEGVEKVLVGNKAESGNRVVSWDQGAKVAKKYGLSLYETSAKTGENAEETFMELATTIVDKLSVEGRLKVIKVLLILVARRRARSAVWDVEFKVNF